MIRTILHLSWLNLKRDRVALALMFVLPILFFSIFAVIFGGMASSGGGGGGGGGSSALDVIVVDEDGTETSRRFADAIAAQSALRVARAPRATEEVPSPEPYDRDAARGRVRGGHADAAVILPEGFGAGFARFDRAQAGVDVIHDIANPIAVPTITGLLQAAAITAAPDILMENGLEMLESAGGFLTDDQRSIIDSITPALRGEADWPVLGAEDEAEDDDEADETDEAGADATGGMADFAGLVPVNAIDARAGDPDSDEPARSYSIVSYYAAGIGVMFLLFSMTGAGSVILEEEESGTLERVLTSDVTMGTLLLGNWLFFALCGIAQLTLMFLWGWLVFDLELFTANHLAGFVAMTLVTAAAAAAFGIIFATACRSRAQLSGLSTIIILVMSALGGSMVPRFAMPDFMDTTALFTFNGWALDGYLKVFWYDDPDAGPLGVVLSLLPQVGVLAVMTVAFLLVARVLARRWETV